MLEQLVHKKLVKNYSGKKVLITGGGIIHWQSLNRTFGIRWCKSNSC
jgi:hypothetical protein